jgi:hypothetical protein
MNTGILLYFKGMAIVTDQQQLAVMCQWCGMPTGHRQNMQSKLVCLKW